MTAHSIAVHEGAEMSKIKHYNKQAHRRWRESVLRRAGYLCEECKRYGIHTPATVAHHIKPRKEWPELALSVENGQALDEFDRSGGNLTVEHTNKAGATNTEKNPLYRVIEQLRADMLVHLRELGLTPAGLKRLQREAETKQDNTLLEALAKLEGV